MQDVNQSIQAGLAAFQRGAFEEARRHLHAVRHPKAIHLLGLVEKNDGNLEKAARLMRRAARLDPADAEIASNSALLARNTGDAAFAESEFLRALELRPDFLAAAIGLGQLLTDQERYGEALQLYRSQASRFPDDSGVQHGLATALLGAGDAEQAEVIFDTLIKQGTDKPEVRFMRARSRLQLGQLNLAIDDLKIAHVAMPSTLTLRSLANAYWMVQDNAAFNGLLREAVAAPALAVTAADILRQTGAAETALQVLNTNGVVNYQQPDAWWVAATAHIDLKRADKAELIARRRLDADPDDRAIKRSLVISLLMQGKATEALPFIEAMRNLLPLDQLWLAYEATALRLLGSERYEELVHLDRFVRAYELQPPDGFDSIESFNNAFLKALEKWHQFNAHPLDQSLRDGSQTPRDLTTIDEPVIRAFYRALDKPIRQYMADVGSADNHPLTARNTGNYEIAGSWSVKLRGGGRHVNHVHPEGWISSSYYLSVPDETENDANKAGWIKFAEPPFETVPPSLPQKWILPRAGVLVLFPSFLWHGTQAINDGSVRVTAPFDVVPA